MFMSNPGWVPVARYPDLFYPDSPLVWSGSKGRITVPWGFITDGASIPKFLDWIPFLDRQGMSLRPGLLHDALYSLGYPYTKDQCDCLLEEALLSEGVGPKSADLYYTAVRWFGGQFFNPDRKNGIVGDIKVGNFINQEAYDEWSKQGKTLFR